MHWFTKAWWNYLLAPPSSWEVTRWSAFWCRLWGHPGGVWYYNMSENLEPDMHCKDCGDDLG
jgi:hypothetical protein